MSTETELDSTKVRMKSGGDLVIRVDGKEVAIAHYTQPTGLLEFTTKDNSVRYGAACSARIGSVSNGTEVSGNVIRNIRVKGDEVVVPKTKRPKMGPEGDAAEDIVQWYLDNDLPQAITRYGIYLDEKGKPLKKRVRRVIEETVDKRNSHEDKDLPWIKMPGSQSSQEKTPINREREAIDVVGVIARRATRLTFTPNEVVDGFQPDDDYEEAQGGTD